MAVYQALRRDLPLWSCVDFIFLQGDCNFSLLLYLVLDITDAFYSFLVAVCSACACLQLHCVMRTWCASRSQQPCHFCSVCFPLLSYMKRQPSGGRNTSLSLISASKVPLHLWKLHVENIESSSYFFMMYRFTARAPSHGLTLSSDKWTEQTIGPGLPRIFSPFSS